MRSLLIAPLVAVLACGEPSSVPPSAPTATASLDVPPLPPPKPASEKPVVRQAPPAAGTAGEEKDDSPLPHDRAGAEQAFQDARQAMQAGDTAKARALFLRSYRLEPAVGTLLNLAMCEEKLGMRDDAIRHYQAAYDASAKEGRTDRAAVAKSRLDALKNPP